MPVSDVFCFFMSHPVKRVHSRMLVVYTVLCTVYKQCLMYGLPQVSGEEIVYTVLCTVYKKCLMFCLPHVSGDVVKVLRELLYDDVQDREGDGELDPLLLLVDGVEECTEILHKPGHEQYS